MKLAFFDDYKLGVVVGDKIVDVSAVTKGIKALGPQDVIRGVIENFGALKGKLAAAAKKGKGKPLSKVKLRPPLPKPENIICMNEDLGFVSPKRSPRFSAGKGLKDAVNR